MRIPGWFVLALALVGAGCPGAGARAAEVLTPLRVATTSVDSGGQVFYAQDMGFFKKAGFEVAITAVSSGPTIAAGVASGATMVKATPSRSLASTELNAIRTCA